MKFCTKTGNFEATINIDTDLKVPTVIYTHANDTAFDKTWYPNGFEVQVTAIKDGVKPVYTLENKQQNHMELMITNKEFHNMDLSVKIVPAKK